MTLLQMRRSCPLSQARWTSERFFSDFSGFFWGIFGLFLGESWEIGLTGGKYRPRSTFCPDRWAENFFEKSILVPLLLRIWIFNNRLIFRAFYGLSSPNHSFHELRADLISLFPVSNSFLVHSKLSLSHFFCCRPDKKSFRAPPSIGKDLPCWVGKMI